MLYNNKEPLSQVSTAGKITILTTLLGVLVFAFIFLLNVGQQEFQKAEAQVGGNATTSVIVLNTPPVWTVDAYEDPGSATSTDVGPAFRGPTNSGDTMTWKAVGTDSNSAPYWLIVCSGTASPTPGVSSTTPPTCGSGVTWGVSATTTSGQTAVVSTTTTESLPFQERNAWYAWLCDAIDLNSRCTASSTYGLAASNSAPFHVNSRPTFTAYDDTSPGDPGQTIVFQSSSTDSDSVGGNDTLQLIVCATSSYNGVTNQCGGDTLATSSLVAQHATATYTIVIPTQDQDYGAFGYIIDEHGHEATGGQQGNDTTLTVNNVAPTVATSSIIINGGSDLSLDTEAGETTGFKLQFTASDNNSCENSSSGEEIIDQEISFYRSGIGSTTCDAITGTHNPNNCYVSSSTDTWIWNLSCAATTTVANDCNFSNDEVDTTRTFNCTFPLWYVADPTDGTATSTQYPLQNWLAEVRAIDDNYATGTASETDTGQNVDSLLAMALNTLAIPYGELEPGQNTGTLSASTSISATGNVGVDQNLTGASMCETYSGISPCNNSTSSTIPAREQQFGTTTLAYGDGTDLSSTTQVFLNLSVPKSTSTTTPASAFAYWGIAVPGTITYAGTYTGENVFYAVTSSSTDW